MTYGHNGNNQVDSVTGFGGSISNFVYDSTGHTAGKLTSYTCSNGITSSFGFSTRNLPTTIIAGSAVNIEYGYKDPYGVYDPSGNTRSYTNKLDSSKNQTYVYDKLNRLTDFNGAWGSGSYTYDATGNRQNKTVAGASTTYNYLNNRINTTTGAEAASYLYKGGVANGNNTWGGTTYTLENDSLGRLTNVKTGGTMLAEFTYDGDGLRVTKKVNGNTTVYHYDSQGNVLSEDDGIGKQTDYVYLYGKLVAKVASTLPIISVTKSGSGSGSVNSAPAGMSCGPVCSYSFPTGTVVELTATGDVASGSVFTGWSGGGCSGAGKCPVALTSNTAVTATFEMPPVADFSASPTSGVGSASVSFVDKSLRAQSWLWNFGDGTTSSEQNPLHLYSLPGAYTVSLQVANGGGSRILTKTDFIMVSAINGKVGDCDGNGGVTISEVQSAINMYLGMKQIARCVDADNSGSVSIAEVQRSINGFLGM